MRSATRSSTATRPDRNRTPSRTRLLLTISLLGIGGCQGCVEQPPAVDIAEEVPDTVAAQRPDEPADPQEPVETAPLDRFSSTVAVPVPEGDANGDRDGDADVSGPAGGAAQGPASPPGSAQDALREAREFRRRAQAAQARGNHGSAFREASAAWSAVRPFADDPACRGLCAELEGELNDLARAANREVNGRALETRPLIEK